MRGTDRKTYFRIVSKNEVNEYLVFLCEYIGEFINAVIHEDVNQIGFEWILIDNLQNEPIYSSKHLNIIYAC